MRNPDKICSLNFDITTKLVTGEPNESFDRRNQHFVDKILPNLHIRTEEFIREQLRQIAEGSQLYDCEMNLD